MRLSKYEKETIILTSEGEDTIQIYTFNASLKRRLAEYAKKYPEVARLDRWTAEGSMTYVLDCLVYNKNTQNCRGDSPKLQKEIPQ